MERFSGNSLKVAVHTSRRLDDPSYLFFTFSPESRHGHPFSFEIGLHVGELFDDGFNAMAEAWSGPVLGELGSLLDLAPGECFSLNSMGAETD